MRKENKKLIILTLILFQILNTTSIPQCKALYDFKMKKNEEEGCLSFTKGTVINVLRRVDKNWAEGRIGNSIGIFPISFVEMNPIAKRLMEISSKNTEDTTAVRATPMPSAVASFETSLLDSSSSSVSSPSNNTSSSNSSTTPNSPVNNQLEQVTANKRVKRNSLTDTAVRVATVTTANRHSIEIQGEVSHQRLGETANVAIRQPRGHQRSKSGHQTSTQPKHLQPYIALYPYKPQKSDELELKKGSIYYVTEKCQDGWFKGMSRSQKIGVFPGNYVAIVKTKDDSSRSDGRQPIFISQANYQKSLQNNPPDLPPRHDQYTNQGCTNPLATLSKSIHNSYIDSIFSRKPTGSKAVPKDGGGDDGAAALNRSTDGVEMKAMGKEKKDSSAISFVKRLTKRSKSPPASGTSYSMDNPVFVEDNPPPTNINSNKTNRNLSHPVHVR